jgi:hypothetical protein
MYYLLIIIAGFGGGAVRGLVGFVKHQYSYKNVSFDMKYFLGMSFASGIIGLLTAMAIKEVGLNFLNVSYFSPAIAFIVGYSGGDFLEGIYKIILKKQ